MVSRLIHGIEIVRDVSGRRGSNHLVPREIQKRAVSLTRVQESIKPASSQILEISTLIDHSTVHARRMKDKEEG